MAWVSKFVIGANRKGQPEEAGDTGHAGRIENDPASGTCGDS
jgi:hypothetical protein